MVTTKECVGKAEACRNSLQVKEDAWILKESVMTWLGKIKNESAQTNKRMNVVERLERRGKREVDEGREMECGVSRETNNNRGRSDGAIWVIALNQISGHTNKPTRTSHLPQPAAVLISLRRSRNIRTRFPSLVELQDHIWLPIR